MENPLKKRRTKLYEGIEYQILGVRKVPAGRACTSADAELSALEAGLDLIEEKMGEQRGLRVLIASDSLSNLTALESGPLRQKDEKRKAIWKKVLEVARKSDRVVFQFVNSHVGIPKNELVDLLAAESLRQVTLKQDSVGVSLNGVRNKVLGHLRGKWLETVPSGRNRTLICGTARSILGDRDTWTRSEQCLIARLRCGELYEMGPLMRRIESGLSKTFRW